MHKPLSRRFSGYTYESMVNDLHIFTRVFPQFLHLDSLGKTGDNREIYHLVLGQEGARGKIFFFGGIHGREYMTSQLLMEQAAEFLTHFYKGKETYKGRTYEELLEGKAIHLVPMANPDGVAICQQGPVGIRDKELCNLVWKIGEQEGGRNPCGPYYKQWKANARGVDLNRNFDALWEKYRDGKGGPAREGWKGNAPEDQEESKALAELTRKESFSRTVSYHSSGSVIYWDFGQKGNFREVNLNFARRIELVTGYERQDGWEDTDPAGYKDWAVMKMQIPSLTLEIGRLASPLPPFCFREILRENRGVWEETLLDLEENSF